MAEDRIELADGRYLVTTAGYDPRVVATIKDPRIPYQHRRWSKAQKLWEVDDLPLVVPMLKRLVHDHGFTPSAAVVEKTGRVLLAELEAAGEEAELLALSSAHEAALDFDLFPLYPYQRAGVLYGLRAERYFLADEMGLGKTRVALALAEIAGAYPHVVVTTASGKGSWQQEIAACLPQRSVVVLDGAAQSDVSLRGAEIIVLNYAILPDVHKKPKGRVTKNMARELLRSGWIHCLLDIQPKMVTFDEGHRVRNLESLQAQAALQLAQGARYRVIATGTPTPNGRHVELLAPLLILDQIARFGGRDAFLDRFCDRKLVTRGGRTFWDMSGAKFGRELNHRLACTCFVRRVKNGPRGVATQLPPKIRTVVPIPLTNRAAYVAEERAYLRRLIEGTLAQGEQLTHVAEMRRLCIEGKIGGIIQWIDDFLDVEKGRIPPHGEKLIVFVYHRWTADQLAARYHVTPLIGGMDARTRTALRDRFQSDPADRLFVGNIEAAGEAITLTAASHVAFCEQAWTPTAMEQAEDRAHRLSQTAAAVNIWQLYAPETVDWDMHELLEAKRERVETVADSTARSIQLDLLRRMAEKAQRLADELAF